MAGSRWFIAQYGGQCAACGGEVEGEEVRYVDDELVHNTLDCAGEDHDPDADDLLGWQPNAMKARRAGKDKAQKDAVHRLRRRGLEVREVGPSAERGYHGKPPYIDGLEKD